MVRGNGGGHDAQSGSLGATSVIWALGPKASYKLVFHLRSNGARVIGIWITGDQNTFYWIIIFNN